MILVDTSVWIEFLKARQPWLGEMTRLLEEQEVLAAEPVFGELLQHE
jgi:predicted nucleic acid-binding protein